MTDVNLSCECGQVRGVIHDAGPGTGNRLICYCRDCQKFPETLGKKEILDEYGGTEIYQVPIGLIEITEGSEKLKCLKLTESGPFRWYSDCCKTPIGNSGSPSLPFMGVIYTSMTAEDRDTLLGPIRIDSFRKGALKALPPERQRGNLPLFIVRFLSQILFWKLTGKAKPNPLFNDQGEPISAPD